MPHRNRSLAVLLIVLLSLQMVACTTPVDTADVVKAAEVEPIAGTEFNRVVLSARAAQRLDIQTTAVREEQVAGATRKIIPYAAVIYDVNGGTWVYTSPEPLTFTRKAITVEYIEDDMAVLLEGPAVGTEVVIVGVAELYGTDTGVGK